MINFKRNDSMKSLCKTIRFIIACLLILIGLIGLLIPVFPTIPFLIAAAVVMGKKPADIVRFFQWITKNMRLRYSRFVRKLKKKRLRKK